MLRAILLHFQQPHTDCEDRRRNLPVTFEILTFKLSLSRLAEVNPPPGIFPERTLSSKPL